MSILLGETIDGKYRIERPIGEGGMGLVLEALHLPLDQRVAIKVLVGDALQNEEAVARFAREARAAARIQSEHVVRVFDVATLPNGTPYLVMEYLEGRDLEAILGSDGPLPIVDAVTYVLQACEALAEAHTKGIVHRDLKPANLFVAERVDGSLRIKILDFGVSKLLPREGDVSVTRTTSLMGSPLYMAPEQMRGVKSADLRADIWSLGIILYELLAGIAPFEGETLTEVCASIVADPPHLLEPLRPDLPAGLEAVVMRCLEKDPELRFQDVSELALALSPFAPEQGAISVKRTARVIHRQDSHAPAPLPRAPSGPSWTSPRGLVDHNRMKITLPEEDEPPSRELGSTVGTFGLTGRHDKKKGPSVRVLLAAAGGIASIIAAVSVMGLLRPGESDDVRSLAPAISLPLPQESFTSTTSAEPWRPGDSEPASSAHPSLSSSLSAATLAASSGKKEHLLPRRAIKAAASAAASSAANGNADAGVPGSGVEEPQGLEYRL